VATPRSRRRGTARPRRKLVWARQNLNITLAVPVTAGDSFGVPASVDALDRFRIQLGASPVGATLVRTRGIIQCQTPNVGAAVNILVTGHVSDTGEVQSGPDQADNAFSARGMDKDYFLYEPFTVVNPTTAVQPSSSNVAGRLIDVKAARKVEELNQTVQLLVSGSSTVAVTVQLTGVLSFLLALP